LFLRQLGQVDVEALGGRMILGHQHADAVDRDGLPDQAVLRGRHRVAAHAHLHEVEFAGQQHGDQLLHLVGGEGGDLGLGVCLGEPAHHAADDRTADVADPVSGHRPGAGPGEPGGLVLQTLHGGQQHPGARQYQFAERRGAGAAPVPLEQRTAEGALDPLQLGGQRGLGQPELRRRLGHAAGLRDGTDHLEMAQLQVHSVTVGPLRHRLLAL
jgi:hypothetical protein